GVIEDGLEDPRRVAEPHGPHAGRRETLDEIVHREIRRGAGKHRHLPGRGAADDLHENGGLAGPGWTVDEREALGALRKLDRAAEGRARAIRPRSARRRSPARREPRKRPGRVPTARSPRRGPPRRPRIRARRAPAGTVWPRRPRTASDRRPVPPRAG